MEWWKLSGGRSSAASNFGAPYGTGGRRGDRAAAPRRCGLEAHLDRYVTAGPQAPLFPGPKGGVRRASFYKAWHKALRQTGVRPDLKPHDLRHLANTMAAKVPGTTLKDLMARLGQSSPQAALRYLHRTAQADRAMAQGIDDELRQAMASGDDAPDEEADAG